ncbi:MAG: hypothetical protein ACRETI_09500 [Steroidobacteraceae bacterium]
MFTSGTPNIHRGVSVVVAAAIVGVSGLALDRGHTGAAPGGAEPIAALEAVDVLPGATMLPEIVVTAPRLAMNSRQPKV